MFYPCNLATSIIDALDKIPQNKWPSAIKPSWVFRNNEYIRLIYGVPEGMVCWAYYDDMPGNQDINYEWGYWPSNNEENRMKAISKFFNDLSCEGYKYFPKLPAEIKNKIKLATAKYDTWWC